MSISGCAASRRSTSARSPAYTACSTALGTGLSLQQLLLDGREGRHGPRIDALTGRQLERHEVADENEVEELGEVTVALGPHLEDVGHDLPQQLRHDVEAAGDLGMLDVGAQLHERHDLPGDVAMLTPAL